VFKRYEEAQAEIERLNVYANDLLMLLSPKNERAEAITEFVDRLKNIVVSKYEYTDLRVFKEIDNLAKKMKEGVNNA
jgi:hypothetical protein